MTAVTVRKARPSARVAATVTLLTDIPLSVLDLAPVATGTSTGAALAQTVELAEHVEALGYRRFWVAEHHGMPGIASSAPPVLIGAIAATTTSIRVGSGGVMLPNHTPLVVAEQFGMLEALHPGRIDLGLGRAPGTDPVTARALRRSVASLSAEDFPEQLAQLRGYFTAGSAGAVRAFPAEGNAPEIHLLGSSGFSAELAGMLGLPFAFAHHFSAHNTLPALDLYRRAFRPSTVLAEPYAIVCVSVVAADDDEQARWLAGSGGLSWLQLRSGRPGTVPTPEEAASYPYEPWEREVVRDRLAAQVIGGPETVRSGLAALLRRSQADELMITTMTHDPQAGRDSFTRVAQLAAEVPTSPAD